MIKRIIFLLSLTLIVSCNQAEQPPSAQVNSAASAQPAAWLDFVLNGKLATHNATVTLAQLESVIGAPLSREPSPYECDSAFEDGQVMLHKYADFTVETDGQTAVVRSLSMSGGNQIKFGSTKPQSELTIDAFKRDFGASANHIGDAMRVMGVTPETADTAYDFSFTDAKLSLVEYWIAC